MRRIRLTRGKWATVDDRFYKKLVAMGSWYFNGRYAVRSVQTSRGRRSMYMHKIVASWAGLNTSKITDHKNRRTLDNRRCNLREATQSQNNQNSARRRTNTSGYRGVIWHRNRWVAQIRVNRKSVYIGAFTSRRKAAIAFDMVAIKLRGKFAQTNFKRAA